MRKEFSTAVKVAAWKRCEGYCEECGSLLKPGRFHYDHVNADGLTGEPTLDNCMVLCAGPNSCHAIKTSADTGHIAHAKRREAKHLGVKKKSYGFYKRTKERPESTKIMPRKPIYE